MMGLVNARNWQGAQQENGALLSLRVELMAMGILLPGMCRDIPSP